MKTRFGSNREDYFAGAGKMIAAGKDVVPKIELDEKDTGELLGDQKQNQ